MEHRNVDTNRSPAFPVTVDLKKSCATVSVIDPLLGTNPILTLQDVSTVNLDLTDHPLLIVVPPPPSTTTIGNTAGSGLVVTLSEDAWLGDAQFTVTIDGALTGGVQTVTASHAANAFQDVTIATALAPGGHRIGINFINDAYGGSSDTDRNLYVKGASYDGAVIPGASAALYSNGTDAFPLVVGPAVTSTAVLSVAENAWPGDAQFIVTDRGRYRVGCPVLSEAGHALLLCR